jgi:hypothetical protein
VTDAQIITINQLYGVMNTQQDRVYLHTRQGYNMDELKAEYNKQLDRLNKGWDYCNSNPEEAEKWSEELYNITKILSNIMNQLDKYQIYPKIDYITTEGFKDGQ